ncbi:MAG: SMC domain-containing protein [Methanomicrobiales archaeon 53_19]|uniref:AAA family ATPase n=1 Tax=Methanocalculus sp. TaxID=2004547 RepID=UPI0007493097|nr:AAA family ATPase [Methanocalculus sp.]KUL03488.1 MAG: SMC domain-containing protein [Methanomicrobiales archaeon 53_19]HIJ06707.1 AAA family ATPase [Methanocalculus sp.]
MPKLDRIRISGYKSIRDLDVPLKNQNILIGANGAGKSNIISLFSLLNQMAEGRLRYAVGKAGGLRSILYYGPTKTRHIDIELAFGEIGYACSWEMAEDDGIIFREERAGFLDHGSDERPYGQPAGRQDGQQDDRKPSPDFLESGHRETKLITFAKEPHPEPDWQVSRQLLSSMKSWRAYHFNDTGADSPIKAIEQINDNMYLRSNGSNLAPFLYYLKKVHEEQYNRIRDMVRLIFPRFDDFNLRPMVENTTLIRLEWRERDSDYPFLAHQLSDSILRFICLATVLLQPNPPDLILIDEPELGLHPSAIQVLAALIGSASHRTQVIVATQSAVILDRFEPEDVIVVDRLNGETTARRLDTDELESWLSEYSLSELWEMNIFGGKSSP